MRLASKVGRVQPVLSAADDLLVMRIAGRRCGIPLRRVRETMRPLALTPVSGAPAGVLGLSTVRGVHTPVLDAAALVGMAAATERAPGARWVVLQVDDRTVALAVDAVEGVTRRADVAVEVLPPVVDVGGAWGGVAATDAALLLVLDDARWLPERIAEVTPERSSAPPGDAAAGP